MENLKNLLPPPESYGIIAKQWEARLAEVRKNHHNIPDALIRTLEYEFHLGFLLCYNNMIQAIHTSPATLALITKAIEKECNIYFQSQIQPKQ